MALEKSTFSGAGVPLSYHRVVSVNSITNVGTTIEVCSYIDKASRDREKAYYAGEVKGDMGVYSDTRYITVPYTPDMPIEQAYEVVKNDFLDGSEDVLEEGNTAIAYALAVADGMEASEVPEGIRAEVEAIDVAPPASKEGFIAVRRVVPTGYQVTWEFEPDPDYRPDEDGTYLKPYRFTAPMEVAEGDWYTDGEDIWECVQSGMAEAFTAPWFDVIEV